MGLGQQLAVIRKRWRALLLVLAVSLGLGIGYGLVTAKTYEATAKVFVSTSVAADAQQLAQGNTFAQARVQTYTDVADSPDVVDFVVRQLRLADSSEKIAKEISADAPSGKVLINLTVTDRSPQRAATIANAVAARFSTVIEDMEKTSADAASPVKLTLFKPAVAPDAPSSPKLILILILSLGVGVVLGVLAAWVREAIDSGIKSPDQLEAASGLPVLAAVPWDKRVATSPIAFRSEPHGTRAESFRHLRTNLQFVNIDEPPRIIAVTSAVAGEGKTHTALNLAAALAEAGQRTCLIEADLRRPTLAALLGLVGDIGLTSVLIGAAKVSDVLQNGGGNLAVMTSGAVPPNPSELLLTKTFREILAYVADRVDVVVVDTAPLLPVVDGLETSALADATILTARAGKVSRDQVRRAIAALDNVGVRPVGTVLSMADGRGPSGYESYYGSYEPQAAGPADDRPVFAAAVLADAPLRT